MANVKRAWKLHEFVAHGHGSMVTSVSLGAKSGRVMVTGGDDKKVNLWAIGKDTCIMSLSGHTTAIECARFGPSEESVFAGSASGALKLWDLASASNVGRATRTLTGHKSALTCVDAHPYGNGFLATGSSDTHLKLWDTRVKGRGCIFTYQGHQQRVNAVQFSPDGQWLVSGGQEGDIKLWDLRAGKLMTTLSESHNGSVTSVSFHPHEFLLCSSSSDKSVHFWDLETFALLAASERDSSGVRCVVFHPEGECLFSGSQDAFRVHQWEPVVGVRDSIFMGWGRIKDLAVASTQLIGASSQMSQVSVYVVDLKQVMPFGQPRLRSAMRSTTTTAGKSSTNVSVNNNSTPSSTSSSSSSSPRRIQQMRIRKSFSRDKTAQVTMAHQESNDNDENVEDNDEEEDNENIFVSASEDDVFHPRRRELSRTPPNEEEPFAPPSGSDSEPASGRLAGSPVGSSRRFLNSRLGAGSRRKSVSTTNLCQTSNEAVEPIRSMRRVSTTTRPMSVYEDATSPDPHSESSSRPCRNTALSPPRNARSNSVQPRGNTSSVTIGSSSSVTSGSRSNSPRAASVSRGARTQIRGEAKMASSPTSDPLVTFIGKPRREQEQPDIIPRHSMPCTERLKGYNDDEGLKASQVIPMNADRPMNLEVSDFMPKSSFTNAFSTMPESLGNVDETHLLASVSKNHAAIMAALSTRGRNLEVIQRLWHNKDAKTAVDHAVSLNEPAILSDLLSVITLRPSIWNLDLCTSLLPAVDRHLLQSRYEMFVRSGCGAIKLILKNFGSVIKSNIDSPVHTVGVDISREERHNKCMECYKDLVRIRAFVLRQQNVSGQLGHVYRELAILMQYLD